MQLIRTMCHNNSEVYFQVFIGMEHQPHSVSSIWKVSESWMTKNCSVRNAVCDSEVIEILMQVQNGCSKKSIIFPTSQDITHAL